MTAVFVAAGDQAALFTSGGLVVAVGDAPVPVLPGLAVWRARAEAGGFVLAPEAGSAGGAAVALEVAPAGAVALVATSGEAASALLAWWRAVADDAPALVIAASDEALAPALLPVLAARLAEAERRGAEALRALALLRAEYEETRETVGALARSLGHRPLGPLRQALATAPDAALALRAAAGLRQPLGLVAAGIAAVALHLPRGGALRVQLAAVESGRVLSAWAVEGAAPGWLTLELPWPVGPLRESALLEIAGDAVLSLDAGRCEAAAAVQGADAPPDRALALRVWTAEAGSRFVLPRHLRWEEIGTDLPLAGVPLAVPEAVIAAAEALEGPVRLMGLGGGAPRPVATLAPGSEARFALPPVARGPADLVRMEFAQGFGEPAGVEAALWVDGVFSGWRGFDAETRRCLIQLPVPAGAGAALVLRAALRRGPGGGAPAVIELAGAALLATRHRDPL